MQRTGEACLLPETLITQYSIILLKSIAFSLNTSYTHNGLFEYTQLKQN